MVLQEIVRSWADIYPFDELLLAVPAKQITALSGVPRGVTVVPTRLAIHPVINLFELPLIGWSQDVDAVIAQNFSSVHKRSFVFVHDAIFKSNPEWFTKKEKLYFWPILPAVRFAREVFTSTNTEALRISKYVSKAAPKITATGLSVPTTLFDAGKRPAAAVDPGKFILSVGRLNVRKNLSATIEGAINSGVLSTRFPIVVAGEASGRVSEPNSVITDAVAAGVVIFLGHVSDSELRWLYRNCALFCYLSLDEGFGLPPLEALTLDADVLASDLPVFHEVLGDSATYVDPQSVENIGKSIVHMLSRNGQYIERDDIDTSWSPVVERIRQRIEILIRTANASRSADA